MVLTFRFSLVERMLLDGPIPADGRWRARVLAGGRPRGDPYGTGPLGGYLMITPRRREAAIVGGDGRSAMRQASEREKGVLERGMPYWSCMFDGSQIEVAQTKI